MTWEVRCVKRNKDKIITDYVLINDKNREKTVSPETALRMAEKGEIFGVIIQTSCKSKQDFLAAEFGPKCYWKNFPTC